MVNKKYMMEFQNHFLEVRGASHIYVKSAQVLATWFWKKHIDVHVTW